MPALPRRAAAPTRGGANPMMSTEAAAILRISPDARPEEIERAFRLRARMSHPDRFVGSPAADVAAAANEFVQVTRARDLLLREAAERAARATGGGDYDAARGSYRTFGASGRAPSGPYIAGRYVYEGYSDANLHGIPRRMNWWVFCVWFGLLIVAIVISYLGGPLPDSPVDLLARLIPLALLSAAFAITGQQVLFVGVVVFAAASAILTFVLASFGSLLSLQLLLVPVIGLASLGRQRMRYRMRQRRARRAAEG